MINFTIPLKPVPKGRPRFWNGRTLTDKKTRAFEKQFKILAREYCPDRPFDVPLSVTLFFYLQKPKTVKRFFPSVKPDVDNLAKAALDSLSEFWVDDALICSLSCFKYYAEIPCVQVMLEEFK